MNFFRTLHIEQLTIHLIVMEDTSKNEDPSDDKCPNCVAYGFPCLNCDPEEGPLDVLCLNCVAYGFPCLNCASDEDTRDSMEMRTI